LWFYRDRQREVDFVVDLEGALHLLEAKWTALPSERDCRTLQFVAEVLNKPVATVVMICRTQAPYPIAEDIKAVNGYFLWDQLKFSLFKRIRG
jgi:hypothetical protein